MSNTIESWDTVTGFVFFVKNKRGRTYPMVATFGLTPADCKQRMYELMNQRAAYNRPGLAIVSFAQVTLTTDRQIVSFNKKTHWQDVTLLQLDPSASQ